MARDVATQPGLDPRAVRIIDDYLAGVDTGLPPCARLTADVRDELRDDLLAATTAAMDQATTPIDAAQAAVDEFGETTEIASALLPELAATQTRRIGVALLVTGPLVGVCWLAAVLLGTGHAHDWRWLLVAVAPVIMIGAAATELTVASTGRLCRWLRPGTTISGRALAIACTAAGVGDLLLLAGVVTLLAVAGPAPSPLFLLAVTASLARLALIGASARRLIGLGRLATAGH